MEFEPNEVYVIHDLREKGDTYILQYDKYQSIYDSYIFTVLDEFKILVDFHVIPPGKPLQVHTFMLKHRETIVYKFSDLIPNNSNNLCTCDIFNLMSQGCKCGGK